jgi:hypothetical protein
MLPCNSSRPQQQFTAAGRLLSSGCNSRSSQSRGVHCSATGSAGAQGAEAAGERPERGAADAERPPPPPEQQGEDPSLPSFSEGINCYSYWALGLIFVADFTPIGPAGLRLLNGAPTRQPQRLTSTHGPRRRCGASDPGWPRLAGSAAEPLCPASEQWEVPGGCRSSLQCSHCSAGAEWQLCRRRQLCSLGCCGLLGELQQSAEAAGPCAHSRGTEKSSPGS